jgi:hypothetical protein
MDETQSRRIAGLLGPTMIVMIVSEFPLVQPRLYDAQTPPVVYLSGVLMFVAGLAIVRAHNRRSAPLPNKAYPITPRATPTLSGEHARSSRFFAGHRRRPTPVRSAAARDNSRALCA